MSRTVAVHVRYKSWLISMPSCAKLKREMTKFCGYFFFPYFKCFALSDTQFRDGFETKKTKENDFRVSGDS